MPRRPNNTACRVAAILDVASGRAHTSDARPAASVKAGTATVARITRRRSVCSVVDPYIGRLRGLCLSSVGDEFASPQHYTRCGPGSGRPQWRPDITFVYMDTR